MSWVMGLMISFAKEIIFPYDIKSSILSTRHFGNGGVGWHVTCAEVFLAGVGIYTDAAIARISQPVAINVFVLFRWVVEDNVFIVA